MKNSDIDRLALDRGWKGTVTRMLGITLTYLGIKYLPDVIHWASIHWHINPLSSKQVQMHVTILLILKIIFFCGAVIEAIGMMAAFFRNRREV